MRIAKVSKNVTQPSLSKLKSRYLNVGPQKRNGNMNVAFVLASEFNRLQNLFNTPVSQCTQHTYFTTVTIRFEPNVLHCNTLIVLRY